MNNLKRILIIALCSVLVVCAIPQFSIRSEAADVATYAMRQSILYLTSYLSSRGYSIAHEYGTSIPSISELKDMTLDEMGQIRWAIANKLNEFGATHDLPEAGDKFLAAIDIALRSGALILSKSLRETIDWWLADSTVNGSLTVGTINGSFLDYAIPTGTMARFQLSNFSYGERTFTTDVVPFAYIDGGAGVLWFFPSTIDGWTFNAAANRYEVATSYGNNISYSNYYVEKGNKIYYVPLYIVYQNFNFTPFSANLYTPFQNSDIDKYFDLIYTAGGYPKADIVSSQLDDTSGTELLTSTNTISSDGTVEGDTTIYMPDSATLEEALDQYNNQSITLDEFLKVLGINSVADDATVQEKEDALTVVVTPSEDYLWFTRTQWGADSLEETRKASASTRAEEDSLADSIANTLNGGSDPEHDEDGKSRGKGLLALLLLGLGIWNTPIIAGDGTPDSGGTDDGSTDGSGDTSGYLQESIAGMAVAGGIVEDLFSAAGGSDGYGLAYTVGASFVIFSVIIGAANYFGALFSGSDTKQNIKSSGKQTRSKSPSPKSKKGG